MQVIFISIYAILVDVGNSICWSFILMQYFGWQIVVPGAYGQEGDGLWLVFHKPCQAYDKGNLKCISGLLVHASRIIFQIRARASIYLLRMQENNKFLKIMMEKKRGKKSIPASIRTHHFTYSLCHCCVVVPSSDAGGSNFMMFHDASQ